MRAVVARGSISASAGWLYVDSLSAYHLAVLLMVYGLSSVYAWVYFGVEFKAGRFKLRQARIFSGLWCGALAAITVVLVSNNLAIMWVGIEATTLLTGFLIYVHASKESLEAMWKYILICSVGVAFAFMGTLLAAASTRGLPIDARDVLLWTTLRDHAALLDPTLMKTAFIFLIVGYGTKAGLAPMHTWLPDAHSQAPAPVSAIFSGFMLNTAMYCIMRYVPVIQAATDYDGWSLRLLVGFGIVSMFIAAGFILIQRDLKRLLAYHSVEHLGIIALGLGLGGIGTFAALFHTLNHSLSKTLAFFSAGRLGQMCGSHDMEELSGAMRVSRVWGLGILGSLLALIGVAPFSVFMSEFLIYKAAIDRHALVVLILFVLTTCVVFAGALGHVIPLVWARKKEGVPVARSGFLEGALVALPLLALLALGLWMPDFLRDILTKAADILQGAAHQMAGVDS